MFPPSELVDWGSNPLNVFSLVADVLTGLQNLRRKHDEMLSDKAITGEEDRLLGGSDSVCYFD